MRIQTFYRLSNGCAIRTVVCCDVVICSFSVSCTVRYRFELVWFKPTLITAGVDFAASNDRESTDSERVDM